jgi:hypothetical protein
MSSMGQLVNGGAVSNLAYFGVGSEHTLLMQVTPLEESQQSELVVHRFPSVAQPDVDDEQTEAPPSPLPGLQ